MLRYTYIDCLVLFVTDIPLHFPLPNSCWRLYVDSVPWTCDRLAMTVYHSNEGGDNLTNEQEGSMRLVVTGYSQVGLVRWLLVVRRFICPVQRRNCGPGSSVGIANVYGLDCPGIESRWGRDFPPVQTGPGAHPTSCKNGYRFFPGGKVRPGRAADHSPPSSAAVMEQ